MSLQLLCKHSKLKQLVDSVKLFIINDVLNFTPQPLHKNDRFYPQFPQPCYNTSYPSVTQRSDPEQNCYPILSAAIFYTSHAGMKEEQSDHA
jgi:hypothetical protein